MAEIKSTGSAIAALIDALEPIPEGKRVAAMELAVEYLNGKPAVKLGRPRKKPSAAPAQGTFAGSPGGAEE
jgi:hypothetical protein